MRLTILAVGFARGTQEGALAEDFVGRALAMGRRMGFPAVVCEEIPVSKDRDVKKRMADEAERLARRVPQGAHIILLDARGKGMTSEDFAEMLGALRDAGTKDLCFVIGGPDGVGALPRKKPRRRLPFRPPTWPHLMVRAMLAEQVYRALTILAGHPYHRA
jgi:23S rRNA (pseudouridine1915-N3)-methyltransferase